MSIPAPIWTPSNRAYHADPAVSSSRLKVFRESPQLYFKKYVSRELPPDPPTPSMVLGSLVNELILRPETAMQTIFVCKAQTRGAKEFKDEEAARPTQLVVTGAAFSEGVDIADAILNPKTLAAKLANKWLCDGEGYGEYAYKWKEPFRVVGGNIKGVPLDPCTYRLDLKEMLDCVREVDGVPAYVELKSAKDPSPDAFFRQYYDLGYHCQAAINRRGLAHALGGTVPACYCVAVGNEEPHSVACYIVPEEVLEDGRAEVQEALQKLAECYAGARPWAADWETLGGEYEGNLPLVKRPYWYKKAKG